MKDEHTLAWLVSDEVSTEHRYEPSAVILGRAGVATDLLIGSGQASRLCGWRPGDRPVRQRRGDVRGNGLLRARPRLRPSGAEASVPRSGQAPTWPTPARAQFDIAAGQRASPEQERADPDVHSRAWRRESGQGQLPRCGTRAAEWLGAITTAIHARRPFGRGGGGAPEIIARQTQHLSRLVDDLLDVSEFVSGRSPFTGAREPRRVAVKALRRSARPERPAACHFPDGVPVRVYGDRPASSRS
jgi:hypothetical protein